MRTSLRAFSASVLGAALLALVGPRAQAVTIDWVTIDAPGNLPDTEVMNCCDASMGTTGYGGVEYVYRLAATEITNRQYAEFLNSVAASDPNGLYNSFMGTAGGIDQSGVDGSFSYTAGVGREDQPVRFVDFFDALRFANWLHNGQPAGSQDATTTEDGAYTLLGANPLFVERNLDAIVFLPNDDEWYKAAYYDPDLAVYYDFPTGSDTAPSAGFPPGGTNSANFWGGSGPFTGEGCGTTSVCDFTDVGAYENSPGPFGTFDQGGNIFEWTESLSGDADAACEATPTAEGCPDRVIRGGWIVRPVADLHARYRDHADPLCQNCGGVGIRLAALPEPGAPLLLALAVTVLAARRRWARPEGWRSGARSS